MKIKMEIDENLQDEEIIVRCRELSDDVVAMQRRIAEAVHAGMRSREAEQISKITSQFGL